VGPHGIPQKEIENEVKVMLNLQWHQNIVQILGHGSFGELSGLYFIDMEYCDCNLHEYIQGTPEALSIPVLYKYSKAMEEGHLSFVICAIIQQILSGLDFIHRLDKVHRDLKPKNSKVAI